MQTTASERIARALGIADLVNATNISYNDKVSSLNESYRDIYTRALNSDDDYFLTEVVIPILPGYVNPTSIGQSIEYLVPVPEDIERIRYIDYQASGTVWISMEKYSQTAKNLAPSVPMYRWKDNKISIIGSTIGSTLTSIRLGYYPTAKPLTIPEPTLTLGSSLPLAQQVAIDQGSFTNQYVKAININTVNGSQGIYIYYNGTDIVAEDEDLGTVTTLLTVAGVQQLMYYQGYVYYTTAASVFRFFTDLISVGTPTTLVTPGFSATRLNMIKDNGVNTVASYNPPYLLWVSDQSTNSILYQTNGTPVSTTAENYASFFSCQGHFWAVSGAGNLYRFDGTTFTVAAGVRVSLPAGLGTTLVLRAYSDDTYVYATIGNGSITNVYKFTLSDDLSSISDTEILVEDINVSKTWRLDNGRIVYNNFMDIAVSISTKPDTIIAYPNNFLPDLLSYQCAIDFISKQQGDPSLVQSRFLALWKTYANTLKRDDYQPERIGNVYGNISASGWGY